MRNLKALEYLLQFEEICDDDKNKIAELKSKIRELKLNIILNKEEDEKEYFD